MSGATILLVVATNPFVQLYTDYTGPMVPILPPIAMPRVGGGWLPNPPPPSEKYVLAAAADAGRQPAAVVSRQLLKTELSAVRDFPRVGKGRIWTLHYECKVFGPDGPYTFYTDRSAIIRVSENK